MPLRIVAAPIRNRRHIARPILGWPAANLDPHPYLVCLAEVTLDAAACSDSDPNRIADVLSHAI